jgi:hypothetical protein
MNWSFEIVSNQSSKFLGVLSNSRNTNSSIPVIVIVALEIGELSDKLEIQIGRIETNSEFGRGGRALSDFLWNQVKFERISNNIFVNKRTWVGIFVVLSSTFSTSLTLSRASLFKESEIDFFVEHDVAEFRFILRVNSRESG